MTYGIGRIFVIRHYSWTIEPDRCAKNAIQVCRWLLTLPGHLMKPLKVSFHMTKSNDKRPMQLALAVAVGLALAACSPKPADEGSESARKWGSVNFEPCALEGTQGLDSEKAYCTTYEVPEDPANPNGRKLKLNLAMLPAANAGTGDPIVFLAGGPGQAAVEYGSYAGMILSQANRNRDILLIDQRGTGKSNPLSCPDSEKKYEAVDVTLTPTQQLEAMKSCHAEIAKKADTRFYTTANFVNDLETIRKAIGATQYNLVGISYGTRSAQKYAAAYPNNVRSMVLDGVAPNDLVIGGDFARQLDNALKKQDEYCSKNASCTKVYGSNLSERLRALRVKLDASPVTVQVRDRETNKVKDVSISGEKLASLVQKLAYQPEAMSILPLLIQTAEQGDYEPLGALMNTAGAESNGIQAGLYMSVTCAEDMPRWKESSEANQYLLGRDVRSEFDAACKLWPAGKMPADFAKTPILQIPTLMLSGDLDPVTPPSYVDSIVKQFPNGRSLVLKGSGHGSMMRGCTARLVGQFIDRGEAKSIDATCLDSLGFIPPFTSFNGWDP